MKVIKCLAVLHVNVAQKIVLGLQEGIIGVLTSEEFLLLKQALDLVNREMAFHVTRDYKDVLILTDSFHVQACHRNALDLLVGQDAYLLLAIIEKAYGAIRAANGNEVFEGCDRVRHALGNLHVTMEPIGDLFEHFLSH